MLIKNIFSEKKSTQKKNKKNEARTDLRERRERKY